jgi:hypothetical protein
MANATPIPYTGEGMWYEWYPSNGESPLLFKQHTRMRVTAIDGLAGSAVDTVAASAPGQYGETLVDVTVAPRTISLTAVVQSRNMGESLEWRKVLSRSFLALRRNATAQNLMGTFRIYRDGPGGLYDDYPTLDILALPRNSPQIEQLSPLAFRADIDLYCPYPFYRETSDRLQSFQSSGGFIWPVTFPLTIPSYNLQLDVDNQGDVDSPPIFRLYGDMTTVRMRNITTGQTIEITGNIPTGSYIEINTEFGQKSITLVDSFGSRSNAFYRVNLAQAEFWWLQQGVNTVRMEADINISGRAEMAWRQRYAGV